MRKTRITTREVFRAKALSDAVPSLIKAIRAEQLGAVWAVAWSHQRGDHYHRHRAGKELDRSFDQTNQTEHEKAETMPPLELQALSFPGFLDFLGR